MLAAFEITIERANRFPFIAKNEIQRELEPSGSIGFYSFYNLASAIARDRRIQFGKKMAI
jgi:hypothetical protein